MGEQKEREYNKGKVWLVGAGPGDPGLLTIKGRDLLAEADVVVYDHLVGKEILTIIGKEKEMIFVGKTPGHHPISQEQINQILVREAQKGKRVVRLKGGDPFLFGRGGEELEELQKQQIPFEVVPGVTSALAVPAYGGIPVTHRDYASSLHIITGHKRNTSTLTGDTGEKINYRALVEAGGTLVFLMGVTMLETIIEELLAAGMDPHMPVAVIQEGTTVGQRQVMAPASEIVYMAKTASIQPPAVIVVGKVCRLSEKLSWRENLPLTGMRILLTRPEELIGETAGRFRRLGAQVLEAPAIRIVPIPENERLRICLHQIREYHQTTHQTENATKESSEVSCRWIVFTSQIGVRIFFEELKKHQMDLRSFCGMKFAVIGEGTREALQMHGIYADLMPETYDCEFLAACLTQQGINGARIWIPRAAEGNRQLVPLLEQAGALVEDVPLYHTVCQDSCSPVILEELKRGQIDFLVFTSSSTVEGFVKMTQGAGLDYTKLTAACIGQQTADTAAKYGMDCRVAEQATIEELITLAEDIVSEGSDN